MLEVLRGLLRREIMTLRREVESYPDDASLWVRVPGLTNTGGHLAHHLSGNVRHYIGARMGGSGYLRDRDAEFARDDLSRAELVECIDAAAREVEAALAAFDAARLGDDYPDVVGGHHVPTNAFLVHLLAHFAYHLGQLDYHRRAVTGSAATVNAVATGAIPGARAVR